MCLSNIYKDEIKDENLIMKNVSNIKVNGLDIELIDIMERKKQLKAKLVKVDLVENYVIVNLVDAKKENGK